MSEYFCIDTIADLPIQHTHCGIDRYGNLLFAFLNQLFNIADNGFKLRLYFFTHANLILPLNFINSAIRILTAFFES